jgi:AcrR family transcriptional regulator
MSTIDDLYSFLLEMETAGLITRTFRRLDPGRQNAIIQAVMDDAAERGPSGINITEVAHRAELSVGSLYQYFTNRDNLIEFSTRLCVQVMSSGLEGYLGDLVALPLREALQYYMLGGMQWAQQQPGFVQYYARAAYQGDPRLGKEVVEPIATVMRQMVTGILIQAAKKGELRPGVDITATARVINALSIALIDPQLLPYLNSYFQVIGEDTTPEQLMNAGLDLILSGVSAVSTENEELK